MIVRPLSTALPGEHILATSPTLALNVPAGWQARPNFYNGRAVSAAAFTEDQQERSGRIALRGQMVAPGVVRGLGVTLEQGDASFLHLAPGVGIASSGEDVLVPRLARVNLASLTTYAARPSATAGADPVYEPLAAQPWSAVAAADRTAAAILVLQPVVADTGEGQDPSTEAPIDPTSYSFVDEQLVDGCRLVLCTWPTLWMPLPPPNLPQWRSRLAAAIFAKERRLPHGQTMLWEDVGIPVALVAFDAAHRVAFLDAAAVVRVGGAPRDRTPLVEGRGGPRLWQARLRQASDQAMSIDPSRYLADTAGADFRTLPPVGVLPKNAIDVTGWQRRFFPPSFTVEAVPVPLEQIDAAIAESAALDPLDMNAYERVRVLVPVPAAYYEPKLLDVRPVVDPAFEAAIDRALDRVDDLLGHRQDVRGKMQVLLDAIQGQQRDRFAAPDPGALDGEKLSTAGLAASPEDPYGTAATAASSTLRVTALDDLFRTWPDGGWETLGGVIPGDPSAFSIGPAAVSLGQGLLDVFVHGSDDAIWHRSYGGQWSNWESLGGTAVVKNGGIAAVAVAADVAGTPAFLHVFACGTSSQGPSVLVHKYAQVTLHPGAAPTIAAWTEETATLPGNVALDSDPAAVSWGPGRVDVFVRGVDGQLYGASAAATAYPKLGAFAAVPNVDKALLQGAVSAVSWGPGRVDVFARAAGAAGLPTHPYHYWLTTAGTWSSEAVKILTRNDPVAVSWGLNRIDLFVENSADTLFQMTWNGAWQQAVQLGPLMNASVVHATSWGPGRIDLFVRGGDQGLWHEWYDGSRWHGWAPLADQLRTEPAAVSWSAGRIDVFVGQIDASLWHRTNLPDAEWAAVEASGLQGAVDVLNGMVNRTNDALDLGFARVQTAMYRVRQQVLSSTTASRLATSPALADIAQGESAVATKSDIATYVAAASINKIAPPTAPTTRASALGFVSTELIRAPSAADRLAVSLIPPPAAPSRTAAAAPFVFKAGAVQGAAAAAAAPAPPPVADVQLQTAIAGIAGIQRTMSIAERLKQPAAVESWTFALSIKHDVLVSLATLDIDVSGIFVPGLAGAPTDLSTLGDPAAAAQLTRETPPADSDESSYFGDAVEFIEHAVIGLRGVEGRVSTYQALAQIVQNALGQVSALVASADARLKALGDQILEARQDVVVARSLFAEEQTLVYQTAARRQAVLAQYVPYLVYQRPRQADLFGPAAARAVAPDVAAEAVPAALASNAAAPPELMAMIELVREAPASFFTSVPGILLRIDRPDALNRTIYAAQQRAASRSLYALPAMPTGALADGITRAFSAQADVITRARATMASVDPTTFTPLSWRQAQAQAVPVVSLGDVIDAPHGRLDVSRSAAAEIEDIQKVATALYLDLGAVDPAIRLDWAQTYAQYDATTDFHQLSNLTRWDQIPMLDRQTMQALVTWIFSRFSAGEPRAVALANDVVRVALLLASHEPVNEILAGYVPKPVVATVGGTVDVQVDPTRIRVGMQALLGTVDPKTATASAHAVVEDISDGLARVRVLSLPAGTTRLQLAAQTPIKLADPARGTVLFKGA